MIQRPAQRLVRAGLLLMACAAVSAGETPANDATTVVQRQLDAYNAHDLEAFVATYGDDVEVYRAPSTAPALAGKDALRAFYRDARFNLPALHAEILHRSVVGHQVVDHERITGLREAPVEAVAVYLVRDGRIRKVWLFSSD